MDDAVSAFRAEVLATLGHAPETIEPGRFHRFATRERRGDLAGWCKLFDDLRGGVFGCYRQGVSDTWTAEREPMTRDQRASFALKTTAATAERAARDLSQRQEKARRVAELWAQCVPLTAGDPVTQYLIRRGIGDVTQPDVLRLHRGVDYWADREKLGTFPAMVAPIVGPDGRTVALHRTYLTREGCKADVPSPKKVTGAAGPLVGACIPLHKPARGVLGVAEGIETALAAYQASGVPTVATYCASAMAGLVWPAGVQRLVIFADNDKAGREAAAKLQSRAVRAGLQVSVMTPSEAGADWCDVWTGRGAVSLERAA